jgi:hypothetical protein
MGCSPFSLAAATQGYDTGARLVARLPAWSSQPAKLSSRPSAWPSRLAASA